MKGIQETPVKVFSCYKDVPRHLTPIVLTIGNFDAVHLGHRAVLKNAKKIADDLSGQLCVLTFRRHPAEVLRPGISLPKLCTQEHKLKMLEKQDVDLVIFFEFTVSFSLQTAAEFLKSLQSYISFDALVLGHDALLGNDRRGDSIKMHEIAAKLGFKLNYLPPIEFNGVPVSSSLIRKAIQTGDLERAEEMLGRRFSILSTVTSLERQQIFLDEISSLCLPPEGVYPVRIICDNEKVEISADIYVKKGFPYLEFSCKDELLCHIGQKVEVIF